MNTTIYNALREAGDAGERAENVAKLERTFFKSARSRLAARVKSSTRVGSPSLSLSARYSILEYSKTRDIIIDIRPSARIKLS
jgi:hypothetical protein